jgi:hypothetical protein
MSHPQMKTVNQCHSSENQSVMNNPKTILDLITEETW